MRILWSLLVAVSLPAFAAGLNDSGITQCFNGSAMVACTSVNAGDAAAYPRQDGRFGRDAAATRGQLTKVGGGAAGFDFSPLDSQGNPIAIVGGVPAATPACEYDNVTGLTWEVKTSNSGDLRAGSHVYTWYSTDGSTNGGGTGTTDTRLSHCGSTLASCDTASYVLAVNALNSGAGLCGYNDWRLPSLRELISIVTYGARNPAIDATFFPNTNVSSYWSAATAANSGNALAVYFSDGSVITLIKSSTSPVRLVRGTPF